MSYGSNHCLVAPWDKLVCNFLISCKRSVLFKQLSCPHTHFLDEHTAASNIFRQLSSPIFGCYDKTFVSSDPTIWFQNTAGLMASSVSLHKHHLTHAFKAFLPSAGCFGLLWQTFLYFFSVVHFLITASCVFWNTVVTIDIFKCHSSLNANLRTHHKR